MRCTGFGLNDRMYNRLAVFSQQIFQSMWKLSLRKKILLVLVVTCTLVFILCYVVFASINRQNIEETERRSLESTYLQKKFEFEEYLVRLDNIAYTIMYSNWAQDLLGTKYPRTPAVANQMLNNANHFLSSLSTVNNDIRFAIFSPQGAVAQNNNTLTVRYEYRVENEPWFDELMARDRYILYAVPDSVYHNVGQPMLMFYYPVKNNYSMQAMGYLLISIPTAQLSGFEEMPTEQYEVQLIDQDGNAVIAHRHEAPASKVEGFFRDGHRLGYKGPLDLEGWHLQVMQIGDSLELQSFQPFHILFLLMIPVALFCLVATFLFSRYLTTPILKCKSTILAIRDNHLGIQMENPYHDEIGDLIEGLNDMSQALASLVDQNKLIYLLKRDAELAELQQKINPHFLYNTLEVINGMILDHQDEQAVRLCETLGKMFRYNLDNRRWVRIQDECDHIRLYLTVLGYSRYEMEFEIDVEQEIKSYEMPKFVLQPIVENSVRHGLAGAEQGCIILKVSRMGDDICFTIMDNGIGMEQTELEDLLAFIRSTEDKNDIRDDKPHVGLRNVYQRLRLEYGDGLRFNMVSVKGRGTRTEFCVSRKAV